MSQLGSRDLARLAAVQDALLTVRLDRRNVMEGALAEIRELMETDGVALVCPVERAGGWDLERFDHDGFAVASGFARLFTRYLANAPRRFAWYDAVRPERAQRNVVLEAISRIPVGEYERSRMYREVLQPLGVEAHRQPRVLLCDGPSLLGWFGAFHDGPVDARRLAVLRRLVSPMRRRLALERRLAAGPLVAAALGAALEELGVPAYLLDGQARIRRCNAAGRTLLDQRPADVAASVRGAVERRPAPLAFRVTAIHEPGLPRQWLATLRPQSVDARMEAGVAAAATRWRLTRRQTEVLGHVVAGRPNASIAATLGVSQRAVELHVTAILDRAGVENRAALVASVLVAE